MQLVDTRAEKVLAFSGDGNHCSPARTGVLHYSDGCASVLFVLELIQLLGSAGSSGPDLEHMFRSVALSTQTRWVVWAYDKNPASHGTQECHCISIHP